MSKPKPLDTLLPGATRVRVCVCVRVRTVRLARVGVPWGRETKGEVNEREGCNGQGGGEDDVHAWEEEKGIEREGDLTGVWSVCASEKDGASWTRIVASRTSERGRIGRRGDKTGVRKGEIRSAKQRRRYRRGPHTYTRAHPDTQTRTRSHTHIYTRARARASAGAHWAVKLAHYRLPDSHHELLEKSIEYKKSPWCARRAEPSPSSTLALFLSLPLVVALARSLRLPSVSLSPPLRLSFASLSPTDLSASRCISRARTRCIRARRCSRQREGEFACIYAVDRRR